MTRPRRYHLHESLGYQLSLAARISERGFEERIAKVGLTRLYWCVLLAVGEEGLQNPSDIASFIGVDRTTVSRCLRGMEGKGLIERACGTGDRRTREVRLTDAGEDALTASIPQAVENANDFASVLSEEEQDHLMHILEKIHAAAKGPVANI